MTPLYSLRFHEKLNSLLSSCIELAREEISYRSRCGKRGTVPISPSRCTRLYADLIQTEGSAPVLVLPSPTPDERRVVIVLEPERLGSKPWVRVSAPNRQSPPASCCCCRGKGPRQSQPDEDMQDGRADLTHRSSREEGRELPLYRLAKSVTRLVLADGQVDPCAPDVCHHALRPPPNLECSPPIKLLVDPSCFSWRCPRARRVLHGSCPHSRESVARGPVEYRE